MGHVLVVVVLITFHDNVLTKVLVSVHTGGELGHLLVVVIFVTLHDDVLSKVFISVHACSESSLHKAVLVVVIFVTFHDDVLSKIFISVHSGGEKLGVAWNTSNGSFIASSLGETSSGGNSLVVRENFGRFWAIWGFLKSNCGDSGNSKNNEFH